MGRLAWRRLSTARGAARAHGDMGRLTANGKAIAAAQAGDCTEYAVSRGRFHVQTTSPLR